VQTNPIRAWAVAKVEDMCNGMSMVSCKPEEPVIDPTYHCGDPAQTFRASDKREGPYGGFCGRIITPPETEVFEELLRIMRGEGWMDASFPSIEITQNVFIDVRPSTCISQPNMCISEWQTIGIVGIVFAVVTGLCIMVPMMLDCHVDRQIRRARYYAEIKAMLPAQHLPAPSSLVMAKNQAWAQPVGKSTATLQSSFGNSTFPQGQLTNGSSPKSLGHGSSRKALGP